MTDYVNAPWTLIEATETHGAYIKDANGTTVCDLYWLSENCSDNPESGPRYHAATNAEITGPLIAEAPNLKAENQSLRTALVAVRNSDWFCSMDSFTVGAVVEAMATRPVKGPDIQGPPVTERSLKALMCDPRYWRDQDPAIVAEVRDGFQKLYSDSSSIPTPPPTRTDIIADSRKEIERLNSVIESAPDPAMYRPDEYVVAWLKWRRNAPSVCGKTTDEFETPTKGK